MLLTRPGLPTTSCRLGRVGLEPGRLASAAEVGDEGPQPGLGEAGFSGYRPGEFGAAGWAAPVGDESDGLGKGLVGGFPWFNAEPPGLPVSLGNRITLPGDFRF